MSPSDSASVRTVADTAAAFAQAVINRDNGIDHIAGLLSGGVDRMVAWTKTAGRIAAAVRSVPAGPACEFLSNLVAATQVMLAQADSADVETYPELVAGVNAARGLSAEGKDRTEVWSTLAHRMHDAMRDLPAGVAVAELADLAAAGQLLLAERRR